MLMAVTNDLAHWHDEVAAVNLESTTAQCLLFLPVDQQRDICIYEARVLKIMISHEPVQQDERYTAELGNMRPPYYLSIPYATHPRRILARSLGLCLH
jgi:hypothetical protein